MMTGRTSSRRAAGVARAAHHFAEALERRLLLAFAPAGPEFRVDSTFGANASVAMDAIGNFVVAWDGSGANGPGVYIQRFTAAGQRQGQEVRVGESGGPSVAMDADGGFAVARNGVYAREFGNQGQSQGAEFRVAAGSNPSIAMDAVGDFVVAWESTADSGSSMVYSIRARRYAADGQPRGGEFRVDSTSLSWVPTVAMDADGDFVIAWQNNFQDGSGWGVYARRYNAAGVPQGGEFRVNTTTTGHQSVASAAMDPDGDFIVAWQTYTREPFSSDVYAQRYGASGQALGGEFRVNSTTRSETSATGVAMDAEGGFVVVWNGWDSSSEGVYAQAYAPLGVPLGGEFRVNATTAGEQRYPSVAMDADGDFVVAWQSFHQDGSGYGVYARRYQQLSNPASVGDFVWYDQNANGLQEPGEGGIDGVTVNLLSPSYGWMSNTITSGGGHYRFDLLPGDSYFLEFVPDSLLFAFAGRGADDSLDSDADPQSGRTAVFAVAAGRVDQSFDVGLNSTATISGVKFNDRDSDGTRHTAEAGLPGWLIYLDANFNGAFDPGESVATTDSSGRYEFTVRSPGLYRVGEVGQDQWVRTVPAIGYHTVTLTPGQDASDIDFGSHTAVANVTVGPIGTPFRVNTPSATDLSEVAIASDADGDFVVTWQSRDQDGSTWGIYAQRFNSLGRPQGGEFRVNSTTVGEQLLPSVAMDSDGDFVIAWTGENEYGAGVYAQRYNAAGQTLGGEFRVIESGWAPSVGIDSGGDFVIAWMSGYVPGSVISARRYDAAGQTRGDAFLVNTTTAGEQLSPSVAMDADGDWVVVWDSYIQQRHTSEVYGQRYGAAGERLGGEFRVNTAVAGHQWEPSVGMDADGAFVVAWSGGGFPSQESINAQRYGADGQVIGDEFRVSAMADVQRSPAVGMDADGEFVISWQYFGVNVYAQRYGAAGQPIGNQLRVNTTAVGQPPIAMDADGDFVIAWTNYYGNYGRGIYAQRYSTTGQPLSAELHVNTTNPSRGQQSPSVAADADGNFVVAWQSLGQDGSGSGVYAQRYDAAGVAQGSEFRANTLIAGGQSDPAVAMDAGGAFVVVWQSLGQDDSGWGVFAQLYGAAGGTLGGEFRVNTTTVGDQRSPSVSMDANGDFVIAWTSAGQDGAGWGVYAQRYSAAGQARGTEFRINTTTAGDQLSPAAAIDADGNFVIVWSNVGQDGGGGVYARRYTNAGGALGGEFRVNTTTVAEQSSPSVAMDSVGDFVITWGGLARRYNAAGLPMGGQIVVGYSSGHGKPSVAMDADGDFVVALTFSLYSPGSPPVFMAQLHQFSAAGVPQQNLRLPSIGLGVGQWSPPSIAIHAGGEFIVVWQPTSHGGDNGILAQRFVKLAPTATQVFVGSTAWAPAFRQHLQDQGLGDASFGYAIPAGPTQLDVLPWNNINQISVRFNENVMRPGLELSAAGINLPGYTVSGFAYDIPTYTATWTLSQPIQRDRLVFEVGGGATGVVNAAGLRLDGEWSNGAQGQAYPTGDGSPGGDFRFRINVLPGDTDRNGAVLASDISEVKRKFFSTTADFGDTVRGYSIFLDINGSGSILADDFSGVKRRFFDTLPPGDPVVAPAGSAWPAAPARTRPATRELFSSAPVLR